MLWHIVAMARAPNATEYRLLVENSPVMIWRAALDAKCDYFNETWLAFTGRTLEQEMGDGWAEGVHPEDLERCVKHYLDHFNGWRPVLSAILAILLWPLLLLGINLHIHR